MNQKKISKSAFAKFMALGCIVIGVSLLSACKEGAQDSAEIAQLKQELAETKADVKALRESLGATKITVADLKLEVGMLKAAGSN